MTGKFRPFRFLYSAILAGVALYLYGWGGVVLVALATFDVEVG